MQEVKDWELGSRKRKLMKLPEAGLSRWRLSVMLNCSQGGLNLCNRVRVASKVSTSIPPSQEFWNMMLKKCKRWWKVSICCGRYSCLSTITIRLRRKGCEKITCMPSGWRRVTVRVWRVGRRWMWQAKSWTCGGLVISMQTRLQRGGSTSRIQVRIGSSSTAACGIARVYKPLWIMDSMKLRLGLLPWESCR